MTEDLIVSNQGCNNKLVREIGLAFKLINMAANSKNTLDVFKWIFNMIETSKTSDHLVGCNKLSHLYFKNYQELRLFDILMNKIGIKLKEFK